MFNFTSTFKKAALICAVAFSGAMVANAATIYHNGIKYTSSGNKLTVAKGDATTGAYTGDIVIESPVTIDGVEYTVTAVAATAFKQNKDITSVVLPDDCIDVKRGAFAECSALKSVRLSANMTAFNAQVFDRCTALEEITIPGGIATVAGTQFQGCSSLKKIILAESDKEVSFTTAAWGNTKTEAEGGYGAPVIEELVINRPIATVTVAEAPFKGLKTLKKVEIGAQCTKLSPSYFAGCSALESVTIAEGLADFGTGSFSGTAITAVTVPSTITTIPTTCFSNCSALTEVVFNEGLASIDDQAFSGSPVAKVNWPASLTKIGGYAFSNSNIVGDIVFPASLRSIGTQAFNNNSGITSVAFPAALTSIGNGAFKGCAVAAYTIDAANTSFIIKNKAVASADGTKLYLYPVADAATSFADNGVSTIAAYTFYGAKNLTSIVLDNCYNFGDYSLAGTAVEEIKVQGTVGRYVLENCTAVKKVNLASGLAVPFGLCKGCSALEEFTTGYDMMTINDEAFAGCTGLKELNLGGYLSIIGADAFKNCGVETLINGSATPAAMSEGVFTEANSNITLKVAADVVDTYKAAAGWKHLNVVGDANIAAKGTNLGMPAGIYYAGKDGVLYRATADGGKSSFDVGGALHTFQLTQFKNRIYGSSAGKTFVYQNSADVGGDGKLFYISQIDGYTFQATVLDNTGNNAYKDPFGLYIYGDTLYVNDRNVCIRKISADAIALPQSYPSWVENNWLGWYGSPWAYGCVKGGFSITKDQDANGNPEPLYWVSMRYNGNGIFRFKEKDINTGVKPAYDAMLNAIALNASTFYIDETNGHIYMYIVSAANVVPGLYRLNLADLVANPDPSDFSTLNPVLIDNSPILLEGSVGSQETGITQLSPDENGEYLYWCYIAPEGADTDSKITYLGTEGSYDPANPMHKSGIKRVKMNAEAPAAEMVVEGAVGYGIVPVNYSTSGVETVEKAAKVNRIQVIGNAVTVMDNAIVNIYNAAGALVAQTTVAGVKSVSLADNAAGLYLVEAIFADGARQVVKVVK